MMKKKLLIIIPTILTLLVIAFFIGRKLYMDYRIAHAIKIVVLSTDKVEVYRDNLKVSNFIKEINGTLITNPKVKTKELGKQEITFRYLNEENLKVNYTIEIEVVDTTPPFIFQGSSKTIYTDYDGELAKDLFCGDIYDTNPECIITGDYDTTTPGTYNLTFTGTDSSGNSSSHDFTLIVKNRPKSTYSSNQSYDYLELDEVIRNYKTMDNQIGIDVSHWQGDIDFQRVKDAGIEFVYIRVGRGDGIGEGYVLDTKFEQNIKGFNEVGIPVGVYFYSYANSKEDAIKEAKWMIKQIKNYKVDLEVVFDWENWSFFQEFDQSFYSLSEMASAYIKTLENSGYEGMLYSSKSYLENVWQPHTYKTWMAHYTTQSNYSGSYKVWQLCEDGHVPGIEGYVDLDIRYK